MGVAGGILGRVADTAALKRLGGGRWQTRDERFTIEPQGGTWAVVDSERTDELGLPLVRGPFPSLTAARAEIEAARTEAEPSSPLATRLTGSRSDTKKNGTKTASSPTKAKSDRDPDEPAWLRTLDGPTRASARKLLARLANDGVEDPEALVRSDLVGGQPALARLAIGRAVEAAARAGHGDVELARSVAEALLEGDDRDLGVSWRLVDSQGRPIRRLDR
jgi:hypothetical protein